MFFGENAGKDIMMSKLMVELQEEAMKRCAEECALEMERGEDSRCRKKARRTYTLGMPLKSASLEAVKVTGNYYAGQGEHQALYDLCYKKDASVESRFSQHIWLVHMISHEWYNNGFMNMEINSHYFDALEELEEHFAKAAEMVRELKDHWGVLEDGIF